MTPIFSRTWKGSRKIFAIRGIGVQDLSSCLKE
jgi:hypothetical protein